MAGIVSFIFVVLLQIYYFGRGFSYAVWYHWFPLVFASSCITIVALKLSRRFLKEDNTFVLNLGKCAFGVYLVHFPLLMIMNKYFSWPSVMPVKVLCLFIVSLVDNMAV